MMSEIRSILTPVVRRAPRDGTFPLSRILSMFTYRLIHSLAFGFGFKSAPKPRK